MARKNTYTRRLLLSRLLIAAVAMAVLFSCRKYENTDGTSLQEFVQREECGLWGHGGFLFRYDEGNCQFSINPSRRQVRMQSDNQDDYVNILFSALPTPAMTKVEAELRYRVGNEEISNIMFSAFPTHSMMKVEAALRYNVGNEEISNTSIMETVKVDGNKFWLWDSSNSLGIIIRLGGGNGE